MEKSSNVLLSVCLSVCLLHSKSAGEGGHSPPRREGVGGRPPHQQDGRRLSPWTRGRGAGGRRKPVHGTGRHLRGQGRADVSGECRRGCRRGRQREHGPLPRRKPRDGRGSHRLCVNAGCRHGRGRGGGRVERVPSPRRRPRYSRGVLRLRGQVRADGRGGIADKAVRRRKSGGRTQGTAEGGAVSSTRPRRGCRCGKRRGGKGKRNPPLRTRPRDGLGHDGERELGRRFRRRHGKASVVIPSARKNPRGWLWAIRCRRG